MKKLLPLIFCIVFFANSEAQRNEDWLVSIGVNAINNLQSQNPLYKPGDWATENPLALAVEHKILPRFYIEAAYTLNGFKQEDSSTDLIITDDFTYHSFDIHAKLYYGNQIFKNADWLDLYLNIGGGYFSIDDSLASFNLGGGVLFWANYNRTIGVRLQTIAKIALGDAPNAIDSNHYQYHLQMVFKL